MTLSWLHWLATTLTFVSLTTCTPTKPFLKRQAGETIVKGIDGRDQNGNLFLRLDVRDMQANYPDQWSLYMIGLDQMHTADQEDPLSYYGIAGIHGKPYKTHLNAPGIDSKVGTAGYCPHSMALFLGWHRPYMALFEQQLHARIQQLAEHAPADQIDRYRWAAYSFRIPYWDWSQGDQSGDVPQAFLTETISVDIPEGRRIQIWNPLYKFDFKPVPSHGFEGKWTQLNHTVRWPASDKSWEPSRQEEFVKSFASLRRQIQDQTALAFRQTTMNGFWEAIEMVHGWVHGTIGGGYSEGHGGKGHMWPLEYSSYEPLFWLHHANVDRLWALYQTQNPDARIERSNVGSAGNVFIADNSMVDGDTALLPFRRNPDSFWTTNEAMDWRAFGYDYPDTRSANTISAQATVAQLFSGNARGRLEAEQKAAVAVHSTMDMQDASFTDWNIVAAASPLDLPPTFVVQFSLVGDFSSDASTDVGMWSVLMPGGHNEEKRSQRAAEKAAKRATAADMTLKGTVSLTNSLLDQVEAGKLESLDEKDVVPFLKEKLTWKVYSGDGKQLPDSSLSAIRIDVESQTARVPSDPTQPLDFSNAIVTHSQITAGKMGGAN